MSKLVCKDFSVKYFGYDESISCVSTEFSDGINVLFAAKKGGKTTFLKGLAGVVPSTGSLFYDDVDLSTLSLKDRDFQMIFDDYALFSRHSARYNLEYPLKIRKVPKEDRHKRAEEAAALFDLDLMIDAPVYRLNEWHKVSLALCRAYLRGAKVILIDNVFARLDPMTRREAFRRYLPLFAEKGIVIYATDDPQEAEALSGRIKLLSYGYLMQEGSAVDLATKPACLTSFLSFNTYPSVLPLLVNGETGETFGVTLPKGTVISVAESYQGKELIAGFIPSDFSLSENGFSAIIEAKFHAFDNTIYRLNHEGKGFFAALPDEYGIGEKVSVLPIRLSCLFDSVNQRAIMRY